MSVLPNEADRLAVLRSYAMLDTSPEGAFDRIARLAAALLNTPIGLVSLLDGQRQWSKARVGFAAASIPRSEAFCADTILTGEIMHVPDARQDSRLVGYPLVTADPGLRLYAGAPLDGFGGQRLGTICAFVTRPRLPGERHRRALRISAALAADELERRRSGYGIEGFGHVAERTARPKSTDLLDVARIEAGGLALEPIELPMADLLAWVRTLVARLVIECGRERDVDVDVVSPVMMRADPTRLQQVLHIIGDTLRSASAGRVALPVGRPLGDAGRVRVRFTVKGTKAGMSRDKLATGSASTIRLDPVRRHRRTGTGPGLAISKRLVEATGGAIGRERTPDGGSLSWFEVPIAVGDAPARRRAAARRPTVAPALRVLVAEDVAVSRDLLREMLGRHGYDVVCGADGVEAVTLVARERFDIVLMDVRMPRMDGIEATRRIRGLDSPARAVPIMALTADARMEERRRCLAAGMDGCLAKPLAWPELFAVLEEAAGRLAMERSHAPEAGAREARPRHGDDGAASTRAPFVAGAAPADLLRQFVEDAARRCELLLAFPRVLEELLEQAHRLKGTASLLGLGRIAAAAGTVEAAARAGLDPAMPLKRLASAVREDSAGRALPPR